MMTGWRLIAAALVVSLLQIGFLGWTIAGRASILQNGRDVLLKTAPVDPRDLLRGDFVRLGYDISSISTNIITDINGEAVTQTGPIFVALRQQADGFWTVNSASFAKPAETSPDEVVIRGQVDEGWSLTRDSTIQATYGLERFYVPEGEGKEIEKDMRERTFAILAAVDNDGVAQIKALMDNGVSLYEEPIY